MFYRRKIILALLDVFGGKIPRESFQQLLFLFNIRQAKPDYDFVPHHNGVYSFSAAADVVTMIKKGLLDENETNFIKVDPVNYFETLKRNDPGLLSEVKANYHKSDIEQLSKAICRTFPYYCINNLAAREFLTDQEYSSVLQSKPQNDYTLLYTIGYEGISLESYLNRLIKNDVKFLVDVRNNPFSMKFGFTKALLKDYCSEVQIGYLHIPEVGIKSEKRKNTALKDQLFDNYLKTTLKETILVQKQILELLEHHKRIALSCFEADVSQCHRKYLAEAIARLPGWNYGIVHL